MTAPLATILTGIIVWIVGRGITSVGVAIESTGIQAFGGVGVLLGYIGIWGGLIWWIWSAV